MKTYLSIGSGPGIGIATAEKFAAEGYRIVVTSRDPKNLAGQVERLRAKGYSVEVEAVDSADLESVRRLITNVETKFGPIDVLHFNAASMRNATIENQPPETFVSDLTVNIAAALVATQEVSRSMLARESGTILLTGGILGVTPLNDFLSLSIGKAGMRALVLGTFEPFKKRGVHIATVTVAATVAAGSSESREIAEEFWKLHSQKRDSWSAEVDYGTWRP